jgi:hypothetical protein
MFWDFYCFSGRKNINIPGTQVDKSSLNESDFWYALVLTSLTVLIASEPFIFLSRGAGGRAAYDVDP